LWTLVEAVADPEWFAEVVLADVREFFGYRLREAGSVDELEAAFLELEDVVERVVELARSELEREEEHGVRWWLRLPPSGRPSWVWSRPPGPELVLEELARSLPDARAILEEGLGLNVSKLSGPQVDRRLRREVAAARMQLARVARLAVGQAEDELPTLDVSDSRDRFPRKRLVDVRFEPVKRGPGFRPWGWLYEMPDGWESSGPWGGSLAWLAEQDRPAPLERCTRCNWFGRFPELIGIDDGRNLQRLLVWADPHSTGARFPILSRYRDTGGNALDGTDRDAAPIDHMDEVGDRACALCGGRGYFDSLDWGTDPRLRPRSIPVDDLDDPDPRDLLEVFDDAGRLEPLWDREPIEESAVPAPALGEDTDAVVGSDVGAPGIGIGGVRREEQVLARRVMRAAEVYRRSGRLAIEGAGVEALKREYAATPAVLEPLALRQFLADASFDGAGRLDDDRRESFLRRDAVVFELVSAGFPLERIAAAIGLSKTRLYALEATVIARRWFETQQHGLVKHWRSLGYDVADIARASGLPRYTVRRIIRTRDDASPTVSLGESAFGQYLIAVGRYGVALMQFGIESGEQADLPPRTPEEFLDGPPIDYWQRWPPGVPLYGAEDAGTSYHTYVPSDADRYGGPADPSKRSLGMLHPFFHALLTRTYPRRVRKAPLGVDEQDF
jgi:hypothetical protein